MTSTKHDCRAEERILSVRDALLGHDCESRRGRQAAGLMGNDGAGNAESLSHPAPGGSVGGCGSAEG